MLHKLLAIGIVGSIFAASAPADTISIVADQDNTLFGPTEDDLSSGSGEHIYAGRIGSFGGTNNIRRAAIHFDVSAIPEGATINSAEVRIQVVKRPPGGATNVSNTLHRCLESWGEGASEAGGGSGTSAETNDVTWTYRFFPDQTWSTPGGDFESAVSGSVSIIGTGSYTFTGAGLAADVQDWVDGAANNGWILIADTSVPKTVSKIASRENPTSAFQPTLVVDYEMGGILGDLTGDGFVNGADLGLLLVDWGPCSGCPGDLNDDGFVNGADLGLLLVAWTG